MRKNSKFQYYVEGKCEKKLVDTFKEQGNMIISGKLEVLNVKQEVLTTLRLRNIQPDTIVILIFDTDTEEGIDILKENLEILNKNSRVKDIWCVIQVKNLEDELVRATDIKEPKDLLESKSNKDFKHDFIIEKHLFDKLKRHDFDYSKLWNTKPDSGYDGIVNNGNQIKLKVRW